MSHTVYYFRKWVNSHGVVQENARHVGIAFPAKDGDGFDIHLFETPPFEDNVRQLDGGETVIEKRIRLHVRTKRERTEPEVQHRRKPGAFQGG